MPYYKLVASDHRPEIVVDEIILSEDVALSTRNSVELSEEQFNNAVALADKVGYKVVEANPPEDSEEEEGQVTGSDVTGLSPVVEETDQGPTINQQAEEKLESRRGSRGSQGTQAGAETTGTTGASGTSGTTGTAPTTTDTL